MRLQVPNSTTQYYFQSLRILPKLSGSLPLLSRNESCVTDRGSNKSKANFCAWGFWFLQSPTYITVLPHHSQPVEKWGWDWKDFFKSIYFCTSFKLNFVKYISALNMALIRSCGHLCGLSCQVPDLHLGGQARCCVTFQSFTLIFPA